MAVLEAYELRRTGEFRYGDSPGLERRWVCTVDDPGTTTMRDCAIFLNVDLGYSHPEFPRVPCTSIDVNEQYDDSRYHIEFIARYELTDLEEINPLRRPDVWSFETQGVAVATLSYYDGSGNNDIRPLTNSAFDYFEGLTTDEAQTRVVIEGNRPTFSSSQATLLTNTVNSTPFLGGALHTWKCQGVAGEQRRELVATTVVNYWRFSTTLMYRQTGWNLQLPDMGFNYIAGGQKRRVMTFDFENSEWIPSPVPMGLNGSGAQTFGVPAILNRRIYREVDFNLYFGAPPP